MSTRFVAIFSFIVLISACASKQSELPVLQTQTTDVTFFDSSVFDTDLFQQLENSPSELEINFPSQFDLNSLPPRIEKWLAAIKDQGGEIKLIRTPDSSTTRGFLMDAVDLVIRAYDKLTEEDEIYESAKGYNTQIFYNADGKVKKIVLDRS